MNFTGENKISSKISNLHERSKHLRSINEGQIIHLLMFALLHSGVS